MNAALRSHILYPVLESDIEAQSTVLLKRDTDAPT